MVTDGVGSLGVQSLVVTVSGGPVPKIQDLDSKSPPGLSLHSLIPCTHECYDSVLHTRPTRAHSSIFAATALLTMTAPPRLRHCSKRSSPSTQGSPPATPASHSPIAHTGHCKLAILLPTQPAHGESTNAPLQSANAKDAGALGHQMEHSSGVHHASTLTPQPHAAIHLQPPLASKPAECWIRAPR